MKRWSYLLGAVAACGLVACGDKPDAEESESGAADAEPGTSAEQVKKETGEALEAIKSYSFEKREEAVKTMQDAVEGLSRDLEALQASASEKSRQARAAAEQELEKARQQVSALQEASRETWQDVSADLKDTMAKFREAYRRARDEETPSAE